MVGSGATGAEFASAYHALRCEVVLVSSRSQVLPSKDSDAARVIQEAFETRGVTILSQSHAVAARREGDSVVVTLQDGREAHGTGPPTTPSEPHRTAPGPLQPRQSPTLTRSATFGPFSHPR